MRDPRTLSERFDLTYVKRRPRVWRRIRYVTVILCAIAGIFTLLSSLNNDHRAYNAGPLSRAHAMFQQDCAKCHVGSQDNQFILSVSDTACLACHTAAPHPDAHATLTKSPTHDSNVHLAPVPVASHCSSCHFEHQGLEHDLRRVEDRACTVCHADLNRYFDTIAKPPRPAVHSDASSALTKIQRLALAPQPHGGAR